MKFGVFTATATTLTRTRIVEILCLDRINTFCLELCPLKRNIRYSVSYASNDLGTDAIFNEIMNEVKDCQ